MNQDLLQLSQNYILIISLATKNGVRSRRLVAAQEVHHGHPSALTQASQEPSALTKAQSIHNCWSLQRACKRLDTLEKLVTGEKRGKGTTQIPGDNLANTHKGVTQNNTVQRTHKVYCTLRNSFDGKFLHQGIFSRPPSAKFLLLRVHKGVFAQLSPWPGWGWSKPLTAALSDYQGNRHGHNSLKHNHEETCWNTGVGELHVKVKTCTLSPTALRHLLTQERCLSTTQTTRAGKRTRKIK